MISKEFTILNRHGLHARPASQLVKIASGYVSEITLKKDGMEINGKSIMGVMMLAAEVGSSIEIITEGPDEYEAMDAISELIQNKFGEE
jgi:phosphocarrier protein HPr